MNAINDDECIKKKNPSDYIVLPRLVKEDVGRSMMNQTEITNHERHESGVLGLPHATNLSDRATFHTRFIDLRTWHLRGQVSHLARWSRRSQGHVRQVRQFRKALATQAPRSQQSNQRLREIYRISKVIRENSAAGSFLKDI